MKFVEMWRGGLVETGVASGCSVAAVVQDADDARLLAAASKALTSWRQPIVRTLRADAVPTARAQALATTVLAGGRCGDLE